VNALPTAGGDFQHKLARRLVDENQAIVVRDVEDQHCAEKPLPCEGDRGCRVAWLQTKVADKAERAVSILSD
jgi:hypothetical protein